ncbi:MAG: hypothetical protein U9P49_05960 [Thermodesulfobacteriota bacterium]|nr:hypothetical protein [Thermodesulfobacteriota bacterium]
MANVQKVNEPVKKPDVEPKTDTKAPDEPYLGTWKTKEDAEAGVGELNSKLGSHGSEIGALKKQVEFFQSQLERATAQPKVAPKAKETPKGPDYAGEIKAIQEKMAELDPDEPGYQKEMSTLMAKSTGIAMEAGSQVGAQKALDMAQAEFKKVLDERDVQATHKDFYREHPDFNDPEMQMRIQEQIAGDSSGMADPLSAYWEIKANDAGGALTTMEEEITEMKRLLDLKKGEEETGKVVTKAQSPSQQKTKQPKATGADLDKGMQGALDALRT